MLLLVLIVSRSTFTVSSNIQSLKQACYESFFSSLRDNGTSHLPYDNILPNLPLGGQACWNSSQPCIPLEEGSPPANHMPQYQNTLRLTPMQAQPEIAAYKPQQFILNNLLKNPLSSMTPHTIKDHWQLYEASVASFNALRRFIAEHQNEPLGETEQAEANTRLAHEYAVVVLHELFFMNTNSSSAPPSKHLQEYVETNYGRTLSGLVEDMIALGSNEGGIGWICALMDYETGHIVLGFLNGNDIGAIGNLHPLLVVDCWEHAFVRDFGAGGRREYVTKYATEIDWRMMEKRLDGGLKIMKKRQKSSNLTH